MTTASSHELGRRFFEAQDRLRGGPDPELCSATYTAQIGGNSPMSLAGHQQFAKLFYGGFPDICHTIDETIAEDDRVVVRFTLRGTHKGDFLGIPPTGKSIEVSAIAILQVVDGHVNRLRAVFDQASMMQQLAAV
jgi:steroid delta-isomerase-like uncharacterized protein